MSPTTVAAYSLLFVVVGGVFLAVNLLVGRFLRPNNPVAEKLEVYECGEPTIGSSFVQFDLRFYVVALLFIIFDVEVAFFFPWATTYGKAVHLMDPSIAVVQKADAAAGGDAAQAGAAQSGAKLTPAAAAILTEFGVQNPTASSGKSVAATEQEVRESASLLAKASILDILAFFAVLMVGFAYVWSRGDLDWVRAVSEERAAQPASLQAVRIAGGSETVTAG
jgi:NADH-quinone oxidoreductase subunit A